MSLFFCFPLFKNPISLAAIVVGIRLFLVSMISLYSRFWFSYVLFLVYVGGLLVIFIYICLVRRNYPFKFRINGFICALVISFIGRIFGRNVLVGNFLGFRAWTNGRSLLEKRNISIFLFLAVLLLTILLVVVRISGAGCFRVGDNEKS